MQAPTPVQALDSARIERSILIYHTTLGVDDWLFVLNVCVAILATGALRLYAWAFVAVALHFALMVLSRLQPCLLEVYWRHARQSQRYTPFASARQRRHRRPVGFRGEIA